MNVVKELVAAANDLMAASKMTSADGWKAIETQYLTFEWRDRPDASYRITEKSGADKVAVFEGGFTPFVSGTLQIPPMMNSVALVMFGGLSAAAAHSKIETAMRDFINENLEELGMEESPYAAIAKCIRKSHVSYISTKTASEWLTVDQVRGMCAACADKMESQGISRVKASVFMAKMKKAGDPILESVAKAIAGKSFMSLRAPLTALGMGKVDTYEGDQMAWMIRSKRGKTIAVVHKSGADIGSGDVVVGDLVVGYL